MVSSLSGKQSRERRLLYIARPPVYIEVSLAKHALLFYDVRNSKRALPVGSPYAHQIHAVERVGFRRTMRLGEDGMRRQIRSDGGLESTRAEVTSMA
jgi:hypothetical protein